MFSFNKVSLEEQATEYLRKLILTGELKMGEKIVESTLAKALEISRNTTRMALNTLSHEGLVVLKPYAGWQVVEMNQHDLWEIYHMRVVIESRVAYLAALNAKDKCKEKLNKLMDDFVSEAEGGFVSTQRKIEFELELHSLIVNMSGNGRLASIYYKVTNQMLLFFTSLWKLTIQLLLFSRTGPLWMLFAITILNWPRVMPKNMFRRLKKSVTS